jgi:sodium-dependent dicarboxylate transporter 2/3/5
MSEVEVPSPLVMEELEPAAGSRKQLVGLALGPALFALVLALPLDGLSTSAHRLAAVFVWAVVYWVTEAVPVTVTALLASVLSVLLGIGTSQAVLAAYADPIIFLFIGSFILALAFQRTGLDRRVAFAILRIPWATQSPARLLFTMGAITWAMSLWVSNTATTAIMLPIGLGILRSTGALGEQHQTSFATALMLMLTWGASTGGVGTPVGSPPNLIALSMLRELAGVRLTFFHWMLFALPLATLMLVLCWLILRQRYGVRGPAGADARAYLATEAARLGPLSPGERNVLGVFIAAVILWILPGILTILWSADAAVPRFFERRLPEGMVALLAAVSLFLLPTNLRAGQFTITWRQAVRIDWGTILLFGGGLSLGKLMFETKLAEALGRAVVQLSGAESVWGLTAVAIVLGIILSETSSNTASASMLVPTIIAVAMGGGMSPLPPVLGATLGASFGFMLPVSTPPNAIVYGTGLVPLREMMASGIRLDVAGGILIWLGLRVVVSLVGLP